ncbi:hypothetical protein BGZ65_004837 [Modicella reniformis]|uniref:Uncharacterized protein n=1 Tax=Modicella reniformis TaxID=1440133 RepID=A0A9P6J5V2_9FUNG|nr:hypothetical protein BGZ65_004837 [Modicella reniformis]
MRDRFSTSRDSGDESPCQINRNADTHLLIKRFGPLTGGKLTPTSTGSKFEIHTLDPNVYTAIREHGMELNGQRFPATVPTPLSFDIHKVNFRDVPINFQPEDLQRAFSPYGTVAQIGHYYWNIEGTKFRSGEGFVFLSQRPTSDNQEQYLSMPESVKLDSGAFIRVRTEKAHHSKPTEALKTNTQTNPKNTGPTKKTPNNAPPATPNQLAGNKRDGRKRQRPNPNKMGNTKGDITTVEAAATKEAVATGETSGTGEAITTEAVTTEVAPTGEATATEDATGTGGATTTEDATGTGEAINTGEDAEPADAEMEDVSDIGTSQAVHSPEQLSEQCPERPEQITEQTAEQEEQQQTSPQQSVTVTTSVEEAGQQATAAQEAGPSPTITQKIFGFASLPRWRAREASTVDSASEDSASEESDSGNPPASQRPTRTNAYSGSYNVGKLSKQSTQRS